MSFWIVNVLGDFRKTLKVLLPCLALLLFATPSLSFAQEAAEAAEAEEAEETTEAAELEQAPVVPQEELEQAPVVPQTEIEEVVVTGSRLQRTPGELAGNLITLDEDYIRSTGEVTLERVLRQLPQNSNPDQERFGSGLNTATNFSGASTVNLRGLGSESTLILVDGKRIGHSGLLGGVSDVSSIPLHMVERIEVLLDGASAIYGSDAVGGVVNIITRKDYQGVQLNLNYNWPSEDGFDEVRGTISGGFSIGSTTRIQASAQRTDHSGMDALQREATLFGRGTDGSGADQRGGPQFDIRFCCLADGITSFPVLYRLDGDVLTLTDYNALSADDQARATGEHHAILPIGFNENSSVDEITEFRPPIWGAETQAGYSLLPESTRDSYTFNLEQDFGENLSAELRLRYENRDTLYRRGYNGLNGGNFTFGRNNPFNTFGRNVHIQGQLRDLPQPALETESDTLNIGIDLKGAFGDSGWEWEAGFGRVTTESETLRVNQLNQIAVRGGLSFSNTTIQNLSAEQCAAEGGSYTPATVSFGFPIASRCSIPPPPAIDPFGDLSGFLDSLMASSANEQTRLEALVRGDIFALPGGDVRVLVGYAWEELVLESATEFQAVTFESPTGRVNNFDTDAERSNQATFFEMGVPIIGSANSRPGVERLSLSLSGRWDSYEEPSVVFNLADGGAMAAEGLADAGEEFSWGLGVVYSPVSDVRIKVNKNTAFVAPQLNQVIVATGVGPAPAFRNISLQLPNGDLQSVETRVIDGGNGDLKPETAETLSWGFEFTPRFIPGLGVRATWSETEYKERINQLGNFIVDPNNLPSDTYYDEDDEIYVQERRWINVSSINREGVDYSMYYERPTEIGEFGVQVSHSRTTNYEFVVDPVAGEDPINVLSHTEGTTTVGVVPRSSTNAQLTWRHRGLEVSLDIFRGDETSSTLGGVTNTYIPPDLLDLILSYQFGAGGWLPTPAFLDGGRLVFTVNNLTNEFGETKVTSSEGLPLAQGSPDQSPVYGRVFNLSFQMSIGGDG
jgi:outer membrane receptor protein involved in Fe transport